MCVAHLPSPRFQNIHTRTRSLVVHVQQYHSVITGTSGKRWLGEFARVVNIVELLGLAVAQIIASASNFYSLEAGLNKR